MEDDGNEELSATIPRSSKKPNRPPKRKLIYFNQSLCIISNYKTDILSDKCTLNCCDRIDRHMKDMKRMFLKSSQQRLEILRNVRNMPQAIPQNAVSLLLKKACLTVEEFKVSEEALKCNENCMNVKLVRYTFFM
jgi:hypothetical protein